MRDIINPKINLIDRYNAFKAQVPYALAVVRLGDFWEAYGEDAERLAKACELTLTRRLDSDGNGYVAMAGFPAHAAGRYWDRLRECGIIPISCTYEELCQSSD